MDVLINYPTGDVETIPVRGTDHPLHFELRRHVFMTPLGPGDVVAVNESMEVVDLISLKPQWIHDVDLHLPADYLTSTLGPKHPGVRIANQLADRWSRQTTVTLLTTFSMVISSPSPSWFDANVESSRYVLGSSIIRTPHTRSGAPPWGSCWPAGWIDGGGSQRLPVTHRVDRLT